MGSFLTRARTLSALGLSNVAAVAWYRLGIRLRVNPVVRLRAATPQGPFFHRPVRPATVLPVPDGWRESALLFGWHRVPLRPGQCPPWHRNLFTDAESPGKDSPWWTIPDFGAGDIKATWELSRFDWSLAFAQRAATGCDRDLEKLNRWLEDWCRENPPYLGANWKCGQEASIRVMRLAMCALILGQQERPVPALLDLVRVHLARIAPTLSYALAQDNNHGTSEAAALFIGGNWLHRSCPGGQGARWAALGRRWLENRVARLVEKDGSFSQYSVNYHRVLVDTLSMAEIWRRALGLADFSPKFRRRAGASVLWLKSFVQESDGDVPDIGANDGARLLPLSDADYRDYRPTVQLGSALFTGKRAYAADGSWNAPLHWLGLDVPERTLPPATTRLFDQGGYALLRKGNATVYLRYPRFRFRPSQSDALHCDVWLRGRNILRDGGSFSYNAEPRLLSYFSGTESHNTVQFDDRDQMPRLGRFLFGDWLEVYTPPVLHESADNISFRVGYRDNLEAEHERNLLLERDKLLVKDRITGFRRKAVLRWRLDPDACWRLGGCTVTNGKESISVGADVPIIRAEIVEGAESRYYHRKSALPVLEIEVDRPATITSEVKWNAS